MFVGPDAFKFRRISRKAEMPMTTHVCSQNAPPIIRGYCECETIAPEPSKREQRRGLLPKREENCDTLIVPQEQNQRWDTASGIEPPRSSCLSAARQSLCSFLGASGLSRH